MTEEDKADALNTVQFAARIAEQILARADDGTKLLTINKHFPARGQAVSFGFHFGLGLVIAIALCAFITKLINFGLSAL